MGRVRSAKGSEEESHATTQRRDEDKTDACTVDDLLADKNVVYLLSPPVTRRYHGDQEASIGWLKTRAMHVAAAKVGPACRWPS